MWCKSQDHTNKSKIGWCVKENRDWVYFTACRVSLPLLPWQTITNVWLKTICIYYLTILLVRRLGDLVLLCLESHRLKSMSQHGCIPFWGLQEGFYFKLNQALDRIQFYVVERTRSCFLAGVREDSFSVSGASCISYDPLLHF